jgi:hypothetical protein
VKRRGAQRPSEDRGAQRPAEDRSAETLEARLALADRLIRHGGLAEARVVLEAVLARAAGNRSAAAMLKAVSARQGDWNALRRDLERELEQFQGPLRDFEEASLRLLFGEFERGWALYESRLRVPGLIEPERRFREPAWQGGPFPGRTLLLHWEQGFGDTLMFLRYAPRVKALGGTVVVAAQRELADLAGTCAGVDRVVPHGDPLPPFDLQASLLSLPRLLGTTMESIPADIPYLDVPARVPSRTALAEALAAGGGKVRVGLAWAGRPTHLRDAERSIDPALLAPLADLPGVAWYGFQLGDPRLPLPGMVPLGPLLGSFSDTAYALSGMDLVISVDTALVHLAGALGVPTLVLLAFGPDFRWLLERADSPWYPSLRLYRQPVPGDWATVLRQVVRDLRSDA